jgi:membrane-associated phospholipid phosphatase
MMASIPMRSSKSRLAIWMAPAWIIALAIAFVLDPSVARWSANTFPHFKGSDLAWVLKLPGSYLTTLVIAGFIVLVRWLRPVNSASADAVVAAGSTAALGTIPSTEADPATCERRVRPADQCSPMVRKADLATMHRFWPDVLPLLLSGPIVGIAYTLIKWIIGRHRPEFGTPFEFHPFAGGLTGLVHAERGLSFPSGHTAMAFATAACLAHLLPRWTILFFVIAVAVGGERICENAHYFSDVIAGAGIGVLSASIAVTRRLLFSAPDTQGPESRTPF